VELSKQVGSAYRIRYKLHPGELLGWKDRYPWLDRSSIEVIDQLTDVYEEFVRADVVVGVYSTAIYEAVAFGLPVLLVDLAGIESAKALIETGGATACSNVDELRTALSSAEPPSEAVRQLLWRPGAVDNFRAFVEQAVAKEKVG
jgi:CDP-glycerol glycerophosphotransferase (TagB/SpsB family)